MKKLIYLQAIALHHVRDQSQCLRAKHYKTGWGQNRGQGTG